MFGFSSLHPCYILVIKKILFLIFAVFMVAFTQVPSAIDLLWIHGNQNTCLELYSQSNKPPNQIGECEEKVWLKIWKDVLGLGEQHTPVLHENNSIVTIMYDCLFT